MCKPGQDTLCRRRIDLPDLPARSLAFLGQNLLAVGGWGCKMHLFHRHGKDDSWRERNWTSGVLSLCEDDLGQEPSMMTADIHGQWLVSCPNRIYTDCVGQQSALLNTPGKVKMPHLCPIILNHLYAMQASRHQCP